MPPWTLTCRPCHLGHGPFELRPVAVAPRESSRPAGCRRCRPVALPSRPQAARAHEQQRRVRRASHRPPRHRPSSSSPSSVMAPLPSSLFLSGRRRRCSRSLRRRGRCSCRRRRCRRSRRRRGARRRCRRGSRRTSGAPSPSASVAALAAPLAVDERLQVRGALRDDVARGRRPPAGTAPGVAQVCGSAADVGGDLLRPAVDPALDLRRRPTCASSAAIASAYLRRQPASRITITHVVAGSGAGLARGSHQ